jgi:predicted kinase
MRVLVVTGLPAAGKTTLARRLARRYRAALLAKDCFKEPLFDALGTGDAAHSRRLSDISYEILFNVARELASAGTDFILEGNLRRGEHEAQLSRLKDARIVQVFCAVDEPTRHARLAARREDQSRHPGHRDAERVDTVAPGDCLLDLPGECIVVDSSSGGALERIDRWWKAGEPGPGLGALR